MPDDLAAIEFAHPQVVEAALAGLLNPRKTLPPKLFYDLEGCKLFNRITELPEYYLTRTELGLLETVAPEVAASMPTGTTLIEYGACDESKARFLLRLRTIQGAPVIATYVPIDIAEEGLHQATIRLAQSHPHLLVQGIVTDFLNPITLPDEIDGTSRLGFFPGSTIGNLEPVQAQKFLAQMRATLGPGAFLLIGVDLRKDPKVLIPAYDDAAGVTALFNRNLLIRLNREAGADFDPGRFMHRAIWNATESRIEMHLVSDGEQQVHIAGEEIRFAPNETIHTENSYKYTIESFTELASLAAWRPCRVWTDDASLFSVHLLQAE